MDRQVTYQPKYGESWALLIGIDSYQSAPPLNHARNDAQAVAEILKSRFGFPESNIKLLTDKRATREGIAREFLSFADKARVGPDDRLIVFFAGHGHTMTGRRGETGYLVPFDGQMDDLASLIRWDELTRNADLIPAKHLLFLMDACYGGLALARGLFPSGSMRFLKDMLQRFTRHVLTAGKADEQVLDAGGPRDGHSIFTGHLLDALEGGAATSEGVISASGVMASVYERVGKDPHSRQTPHYGFLEGDGDFIFDTSPLEKLATGEKTDTDLLVNLTPTSVEPDVSSGRSVIEIMKDLLPDDAQRIRLDDFVSAYVRITIQELNLDHFSVQTTSASKDEFIDRLKKYEEVVKDLQTIAILVARWGETEQIPVMDKVFTRIAEADKGSSGKVLWLNLGWYPCLLLMYSAGIAALSASKFEFLKAIFLAPVRAEISVTGQNPESLIIPVVSHLTEIVDNFKLLPGHERHYTPRSEYLFKLLQPPLEDLLFLGRSYESLFDRFEILLALVFADVESENRKGIWGPPGRFAWKHSRSSQGKGPYIELMEEADRAGQTWEPLRSGLFGGSLDRFHTVANHYRESLDRLGWW